MTVMSPLVILIPLFFLLLPAWICRAQEGENRKTVTVETELDAYYSNIGLYVSLTDSPIPRITPGEPELKIYRDLFLGSLIPRFLLLEASVNPLPCLGVFIKKNYRSFYDDSQPSEGLNLVKAVTAGLEQPYAFSFFLGDVINFLQPNQTSLVSNKGYMGYLVSTGNYTIWNNEAISDNWLGLEWKVKGDRSNDSQSLHWSFRVGTRLHHHPEIRDVLYLSLRRSRIDYEGKVLSWLDNSGFGYTLTFDAANFEVLENTTYVSKKWPVRKLGALSLDLGFIITNGHKYTGNLHNTGDDDTFTLIFRPNLEF